MIRPPSYEGRGLVNLVAEIERRLTGTSPSPGTDRELSRLIPDADTYVLVLFDGLGDHRPPGHGTADWDYIARLLPPHIPRVLEINQRTPEEDVAASIPFLRARGVL